MNPIITCVVPCYNSAAYLDKCVQSLIEVGDRIEIILVNDGSTDSTADIINRYSTTYKNIYAVHKENGGHGSGVNKGIELAKGIYFKVVDSDDWVNPEAMRQLLNLIENHLQADSLADLYITNFIYDKQCDNTSYLRKFDRHFPVNCFFTWKDVKKFKSSDALMLHCLLFKTEILRKSNTILPEKTFYVDNIYSYKPLPYVKKLYYYDINIYHYLIGREDQSVNIKQITSRYDQQIKIMKIMFDLYTFADIKRLEKALADYMLHNLSVLMMMTLMFITGSKEEIKKRKAALKEIWIYLKEKDKKMYKFLRWRSYCVLVCHFPWSLQRYMLFKGYQYYTIKLKCS